ncbi:hypothetical protein PF001_g3988 [Phytophthora fragariae]|nr:hypothetical protein PF003_g14390 [Phytophthora fragariae]KAE8945479.1 hypothetical protein PF009_g4861 [Phytophthora fragariae]KAE9153342.1 hypothetical protein PF006_g2531 [Phytophthora fragariae]KAE9323285.1 hypothetical protein PF001_g3988 [Phytophthora fragariae]
MDCTGKKKEGQAMFALAVGNSNSCLTAELVATW